MDVTKCGALVSDATKVAKKEIDLLIELWDEDSGLVASAEQKQHRGRSNLVQCALPHSRHPPPAAFQRPRTWRLQWGILSRA